MSMSRAEPLRYTGPARHEHVRDARADPGHRSDDNPPRDDNPLKQAMAAVDLQFALEELDRDDPLARLETHSLEERLAAELVIGLHRGGEEDDGDRADSAVEDAAAPLPNDVASRVANRVADRVADRVERACEEIADEARTDLLVQRMIEARSHLAASLTEADSDDPRAPLAERRPGANAFLSAFAARRLALACSMAAVFVAGGVFLKTRQDSETSLNLAKFLTAPATEISDTRDDASAAGTLTVKAALGPADTGDRPVVRPAATRESSAAAPDWRNGLSARISPVAQKPATSDSAEVALLEARLRQFQTHAARLQRSVDTAYGDELPRLKAQIESGQAEIALLKRKIGKLEAGRQAVETTPAALAAAPPAAPPRTDFGSTGQDKPKAAAPALQPRDPREVEIALAESLGLESLAPAQRATLKDSLVKGECLSTALSGVFDHVPVLAMRDLVHRLDGSC